MKVTVNDVVLADHGDSSVIGFHHKPSRIKQRADFVRAATPKFFDRGNRGTEMSFSITRTHKTVSDSEQFVLEHPDEVPGSGLVTFETSRGMGTKRQRFLEAAVVEVTDVAFVGLSSTTTYSISGGALLTEKPE